jgi:hypothetical protein
MGRAMKQCQTTNKDSKVKLEEKRTKTKAIFVNKNKASLTVTKFDGCVVTNDTAADFIVSKKGYGDLVVELKGKNVEHGAAQTTATAEYITREKLRQGKIAGLIVCRRYPKEDTTLQRLQLAFAKKFNGPLRTSEKIEYDFEKCFAFA